MAAKQASRRSGEKAARTVPYAVRVDGAREVVLTGDFTGWSAEGIRLVKGPDDTWSAPLMLASGRYEYRLRVDGLWQDDPAASERVPNPFGTHNAVLHVT